MAKKPSKTQSPRTSGARPGMPSSRALSASQPFGPARPGMPGYAHPGAKGPPPKGKKGKKKRKQDPNSVYRREKEKRIKKGRDYFFIMRKPVCFVMFLLFAVCIGLFAVGYLKLFPEYTSLYTEPDYTPKELRISTEDEDGVLIEYQDQSVYYSTVDPIFGILKIVPVKALNDLGESPKYNEMAAKAEEGNGDMISTIALKYYPVAMILFIIVALINMFKAFFALFGKRVYKRFGLSALLMIIFAAVVLLAGVALNMPNTQTSLNYGDAVPFLTGGLLRPEGGPVNAAGFGLIAMIGIPVFTLVLSMFAKKKIPFSIFD